MDSKFAVFVKYAEHEKIIEPWKSQEVFDGVSMAESLDIDQKQGFADEIIQNLTILEDYDAFLSVYARWVKKMEKQTFEDDNDFERLEKAYNILRLKWLEEEALYTSELVDWRLWQKFESMNLAFCGERLIDVTLDEAQEQATAMWWRLLNKHDVEKFIDLFKEDINHCSDKRAWLSHERLWLLGQFDPGISDIKYQAIRIDDNEKFLLYRYNWRNSERLQLEKIKDTKKLLTAFVVKDIE